MNKRNALNLGRIVAARDVSKDDVSALKNSGIKIYANVKVKEQVVLNPGDRILFNLTNFEDDKDYVLGHATLFVGAAKDSDLGDSKLQPDTADPSKTRHRSWGNRQDDNRPNQSPPKERFRSSPNRERTRGFSRN